MTATQSEFDWQFMLGYSLTEWFELSLVTSLIDSENQIIMPKFLFYRSVVNSWLPGFAIGMGYIRNWFSRNQPEQSGTYALGIFTWRFYEDRLNIHVNLGQRTIWAQGLIFRGNYGGLGFEISTFSDNLRFITELYTGDPFDLAPAPVAYQYGLRWLKSDYVNFDLTLGQQRHMIELNTPGSLYEHWIQIGIRLLIDSALVENPSFDGASGLFIR